MPEYGGKKYAYTPAGRAEYKKAKANGKKAKPKSRRGKK